MTVYTVTCCVVEYQRIRLGVMGYNVCSELGILNAGHQAQKLLFYQTDP